MKDLTMLSQHPRPRIVLSSCIGFSNCQYDGTSVSSDIIEQLRSHVDFLTICPETEIELSTPRHPLRLVSSDNSLLLFQKETGYNYTQKMHSFSSKFCNTKHDIDGFVLRSRSATCGIRNVKIYSSPHKKTSISSKGRGLFAMHIIDSFSDYPVEDEERLTNPRIGEHFFSSVFALAGFRTIRKSMDIRDLIEFQTRNNLLFSLYNQNLLRQMKRLTGHFDLMSTDMLFARYGALLRSLFRKLPTFSSAENLLIHALDHLRERITPEETGEIQTLIEEFRNKKITLHTCISYIYKKAVLYNDSYILAQSFFNPYPAEITEKRSHVEYSGHIS